MCKMPCLITVEKEINQLRYSSLPYMLRAARYQPGVLQAADLDVESSMMGLKGSPTAVVKIFSPSRRNQGVILRGDDDSNVSQLIEMLAIKTEIADGRGD